MQRLLGKVALVTGAASGIGRATAIRLAQEGAAVMLADMNEAGLQEVAGGITAEGGIASIVVYNALDRKSCRQIVRKTIDQLNQLDVLCNIAGIDQLSRFEEMAEDHWDRTIEINLSSLFVISQEAIPHLLKTQGNIVSIASAAAKQGQPYHVDYCAAKAGVSGMTRALAAELGDRGVRVNAICPGGVKTAITDNFELPENANMTLINKMYPLPDFTMAEAEEIAAMVAYLASEEAKSITGADFSIDGGQTIL